MVPSNSSSLPVEIIPFKGGVLEALRSGGQGWLNIRKACDVMGIDSQAQQRRLSRQGWAVGAIMAVTDKSTDGKSYEMSCLRIDRVAMWLATLEASRIKDPKVRAQVEVFQSDAADALDRWFRGGNGGGNSGAAEHLVPAFVPGSAPVKRNPIEALDVLRGLMSEALDDVKTSIEGQQSTIDLLNGRVSDMDKEVRAVKEFIEHAPLRSKQKRAKPQSLAAREPRVLSAFVDLLPDNVTARAIADRIGCTVGQAKVSMTALQTKGEIGQVGTIGHAKWVLLGKKAPPVLSLLPMPPAPPINPIVPPRQDEQTEMPLGPTSRDKLNKLVRQYCEHSGISHADAWHELYRFMEEDGHRVTSRMKAGEHQKPIDYMDEKRLCIRAYEVCCKRWKFDPVKYAADAQRRMTSEGLACQGSVH